MTRTTPRRDRNDASGYWPHIFGLLLTLCLPVLAYPALAQPTATNPTVSAQTPPIAPSVREVVVPPPLTLEGPQGHSYLPSRPLTADEAAGIALRLQPTIAAARAAIASAQGRTQQTRAGMLPTLTLSGTYTHVENISTQPGAASSGGSNTGDPTGGVATGGPTTGNSNTASGFVGVANLRQLLFDFNHTRDLVRQAALQVNATEDNLARVQSDLVFQVKQAFYLYVQSGQITSINDADVVNRKAQLALATARLNAGLGLPSDVVTAETALSAATTALIIARNNEMLARINLALLMGIDPRTPLTPAAASEPPPPTNDMQTLIDVALKQRPEIKQALKLISSAQFGVSAAHSSNAPAISGNFGVVSRGDRFIPGNDTLNLGLTLIWNPLDGGLSGGKVKEARANVDTARAQLAGAQQTVISDVSQSYVSLRNSEQRVVATDTGIANAEEGVRIAQGRFNRGLGLFLDIINAQAALVAAKNDRAAAQYGVDQARTAISHAIGAGLPH